MSYGTSDTTVISSPKTEAHNLNAVDASAAQRDDSSPAPKNRHLHLMVKFFLLTLLVTGLLIGGKAKAWLFPFLFSHLRFSFFVFFTFLRRRVCVWSIVGTELNLSSLSLRE